MEEKRPTVHVERVGDDVRALLDPDALSTGEGVSSPLRA